MYCSRKNCFDKCPNCNEKFIVMADVDYDQTEYFCFDTYDDARACFDRIEKDNFYYGLYFFPESAILLSPENGLFSELDSF